jgi:hypothetical protein
LAQCYEQQYSAVLLLVDCNIAALPAAGKAEEIRDQGPTAAPSSSRGAKAAAVGLQEALQQYPRCQLRQKQQQREQTCKRPRIQMLILKVSQVLAFYACVQLV